jgi:tetratricopeptide (TPR) repeat protein
MSNPYMAWASCLVLLSVSMPVMAIRPAHPKSVGIERIAQEMSEEDFARLVRQSTVRIVTGQNKGSGTIISKRDNTYLILTNSHVVRGAQSIQVQTFDAQTYQATVVLNAFTNEQDLALLEITSTKSYSVPEIAAARPRLESDILTAGYGASDGKFRSSKGKVQQSLAQGLKEGYQLGYSGEVVQGMSGGPVFDEADYNLIGINGRAAFPVVSSYVYEDGSKPSAAEVRQMRQVNWSIPMQTVLAQIQPQILTVYRLSPPQVAEITKPAKPTGWVAQLEAKAKQFVVRIDSSSGANGSGVIIAKRGNTYTVITANHVVCETENGNPLCLQKSYTIVAPDGQTITIESQNIQRQVGVELAILQFESNTNYGIATLGQYSPKGYDEVFVAGFPKVDDRLLAPWQFNGGIVFERNQGTLQIGSYALEQNNVGPAQSQASFRGGYELVYTSITYKGMSGGAVLDRQGQVIGIHGLAEGEANTSEGNIQLGYSLGIPINTVLGLMPRFKINPQVLSISVTAPAALNTEQAKIFKTLLTGDRVPTSNATAKTWIERGNQLWRLARFPEAEKAFERAIQLKPSFEYLAWHGKGLALIGQKKNELAITALEIGLKKKPDYLPALKTLSLTYYWIGQHDKALVAIERAIQQQSKNKPDANLYNQKSTILSELKRYTEALTEITQAIALAPRAEFYRVRGKIYYDSQQYDKAITEYDNATAIDPKYLDVYNDRGAIYQILGQFDKAIAEYNKTILIDPEYEEAYYNRGLLYFNLSQYDQALLEYNKGIAINHKYTNGYLGRGLVYQALGQFEKAIAEFNQVLTLNNRYALAYGNRGLAYARKGNMPQAKKDLQIAAKLSRQQRDFNGYEQYIKILQQLGVSRE